MQFAAKIAQWVLPHVINIAEKYLPTLLESAVKRIFLGGSKKMSKISINVKSLTGVIPGAKAIFDLNERGTSTKISDAAGAIAISGLSAGTYKATVSADGYKSQDESFTLVSDEDVQTKDVILQSDKTVEEAATTVAASVVSAAEPVLEKVATAVTNASSAATSYEQVKADYKSILATIDSQKAAVTDALKNGAIAVIQAEGAKLNVNITQKLNDSMHWYVAERSKIPCDSLGIPKGFDNLVLWGKYTSMIAGISLARKDGVLFLSELCTKLMNL